MLDNEQSLFFIRPSSETHEARKQRLICLCHLKKTFMYNFKFELFIETKPCEHFRISKRIFLQAKFIGKSLASGPKNVIKSQ